MVEIPRRLPLQVSRSRANYFENDAESKSVAYKYPEEHKNSHKIYFDKYIDISTSLVADMSKICTSFQSQNNNSHFSDSKKNNELWQ